MKKILYIAALAATLASCDRNSDIINEGGLELNLSVVGLATKATTPGVNELNENKIFNVDVFFYDTDAENTSAKLYKRLAVNNTTGSAIENVRLSSSELATIGGGSSPESFYIYVIANRPESVTVTGEETIEQLNVKAVSPSKQITEKQDWFTMTGKAQAEKNGLNYDATVTLKRVMVKFGISIVAQNYNGEIDGTNGTWEPMTSTASVKFFGLKDDGKIGGSYNTPDTDADTYRSIPAVFYSFPLKPLPEDKPYYLIKLTWQLSTDHSVTKDTYYMVVCDYETFDANSFYQLDVDINYAGSMSEPIPAKITPDALTFRVADWKDGKISGKDYHTEAVIKEARYLVVYANEYTMNNVNSIDIPYTSSHPCKVRIESAKWTDFSKTVTSKKYLSDASYLGNKDQKVSDPKDGYFTLSHTLDNDFLTKGKKTYDVSPIVFTVEITHSDREWTDPDTKTIVVTQLPAITIRADINDNGTSVRFYNGKTNSAENLGGITAIGDQTENMFIISVSALPQGSDFIIGDPRTDAPVAWNEDSFFGPTNSTLAKGGIRPALSNTDADIDGDGHTMQYYYPTREDGSADNVISPSFRTSSGYSRCGSYNNRYEIVRRRAAVYQEKGNPAGRWRLLTRAEATIVAKLNSDDKIPDLFSNDNNFLVANGYMRKGTVNDSNASTTGSVRLCYDEWYWSQSQYPTCNPTTFTWGDMPR